jgi:hypothetical protein
VDGDLTAACTAALQAVGIQLTQLADAEEAADVIRLLNGNGVTAIGYFETALGLQAGQSDYQALQLL